ncbi:accessory gene regulator B family protein [Ruminococcaceae bacterium OttesenSCG-928-A16]|nr:accessory gene regulator B family protein [Ruminococcaceae bacterium OttesenSCG-928-A16]
MANMIDKLVGKAIGWADIADDEVELYQYAYTSSIYAVITLAGCLIVAAVLGRLLPGLLFLLLFKPLRQYAGGYHQSSYLSCLFASILAFTAVVLPSLLPLTQTVVNGLCIATMLPAFAIIRFAPMEDENKPLSENEKKVFHKRALIILAAEIFISFLLFLFPVSAVYRYFCIMPIYISALLVFVKVVQNKVRQKQ